MSAPSPSYLETSQGRRLAYHATEGQGPMVVFLGGLKSDMDGSKALHLEDWAQRTGRAFLRFDYSGHGQSSGVFAEGCIGEWSEDAAEMLAARTEGPLVLVGSSMGGWISLRMARALPERVVGLVTVAAAPDFTEDEWWEGMSEAEKAQMDRDGFIARPSDYEDSDYIITRKFIEDGRQNLVLRDPLPLPMVTRFLHGTGDETVSTRLALRLLDHAQGPDMRLTLVDGADHRFSEDRCLALIADTVEDVLAQAAAA
ncbi:alpha/beta fold hydrolase [Dinoroseobacter sp. S375]|uniref:alpha/beta fold hydrolase n=1 Tax=Dinoroseobacter sp. S375 TaxID=3415136 RepID=UPI003C7BFAC3